MNLETTVLFLLVVSSATSAPTFACCQHMPPEICCEREPRDLSAGATPRAIQAAKAWESLWKLITHPKTAYLERLFLAKQAPSVFSVDFLPILMSTLGQLEQEEDLHNWGLVAVNRSNAFDMENWFGKRNRTVEQLLESLPRAKRRRALFGHVWVLPRSQTGEFPAGGWKSYEVAPWPLQVKNALWRLLSDSRPREQSNQERWIEVAMTMPVSTDREASLFVSAVSGVAKNLRALERLRRILIEPHFNEAARNFAADLPGRSLDLGPTELQDLAQILLLDLLSSQQDRFVKNEGLRRAYALKRLCDPEPTVPCNPEPATLVLELSRLASDAAAGSNYDRYYSFALPIQELLNTPISIEGRSPSNEIEAQSVLTEFQRGLTAQRSELERRANEEAPRLAAMRLRLSRAANPEGGVP